MQAYVTQERLRQLVAESGGEGRTHFKAVSREWKRRQVVQQPFDTPVKSNKTKKQPNLDPPLSWSVRAQPPTPDREMPETPSPTGPPHSADKTVGPAAPKKQPRRSFGPTSWTKRGRKNGGPVADGLDAEPAPESKNMGPVAGGLYADRPVPDSKNTGPVADGLAAEPAPDPTNTGPVADGSAAQQQQEPALESNETGPKLVPVVGLVTDMPAAGGGADMDDADLNFDGLDD